MLLVCNPAPKPDLCGVCGCVLYVFPSAIDAMIHNSCVFEKTKLFSKSSLPQFCRTCFPLKLQHLNSSKSVNFC